MRAILFDLGDTLEDNEALRPGALETLTAIGALHDAEGQPPVLALVSDWYDAATSAELKKRQKQYAQLLATLGLSGFFKPFSKRVTLSSEFANIYKPDTSIFRAALDKVQPGLPFHHAIFITENAAHVTAARELGMMAIEVQAPGLSGGEVSQLTDLIPLVERLLAFAPCGKRRAEAVGRRLSQSNKSKQADPQIKAVLARVSQPKLRNSLKQLVQFGTRWTYASNVAQVPTWIQQQFVALGLGAQIRFQPFTVPGSQQPQRNVLCGPQPGAKGLILVCCHYDSISEKSATAASGADDDASGVAAILELARLLKPLTLKRDVLLAAFGGEEQGLYGSSACADIAAQQHWPIDVVINLDMISFKSPGAPPRIVVEYDQGNKNPGNDTAAKAFGLLMAQAAADYTTLSVEHTDIWSSDYLPFEAKGYACIGAYNAEDNPNYHKSSDTLANVNVAQLAEVVKMVMATILILGK